MSNSYRFHALVRSSMALLLTLTFSALAMFPPQLSAAEHLVSQEELRRQITAASAARQNDLRDVHSLLSAGQIEQSLQSVGIEARQIRDAVSLLDDAELARLAERARTLENDLQAGALTNEQLTYIVIALATAVIVLIAV